MRDAAGDFIQHNPSMLCYNSLSDREVKTVFCIENIFDEILRKKQQNVNVYFHNLKYDAQFILTRDFHVIDMIESAGKLITFTVLFQGAHIHFRDTLVLF